MENKIKEISSGEFDDFVKKGYVLVDFFADWCMPCKMMHPILDELSKKFEGKVTIAKVDIDSNQDLAQKFKVVSIPNFVLFKDGKQVHQFMGATSAENFEKKLKDLIK
jgi:thioredoxin 1